MCVDSLSDDTQHTLAFANKREQRKAPGEVMGKGTVATASFLPLAQVTVESAAPHLGVWSQHAWPLPLFLLKRVWKLVPGP